MKHTIIFFTPLFVLASFSHTMENKSTSQIVTQWRKFTSEISNGIKEFSEIAQNLFKEHENQVGVEMFTESTEYFMQTSEEEQHGKENKNIEYANKQRKEKITSLIEKRTLFLNAWQTFEQESRTSNKEISDDRINNLINEVACGKKEYSVLETELVTVDHAIVREKIIRFLAIQEELAKLQNTASNNSSN